MNEIAGLAFTLLGILYLWYCFVLIRRRAKAEQILYLAELERIKNNTQPTEIPPLDVKTIDPTAHHQPPADGLN